MSESLFVNVPQYYPQTDSHTAHADRMCFSSTNAMAIKFLRPGAFKGFNADDDYLRVVLKYGDTTELAAQQRAIRTFGLESRFTNKASIDDLRRILREGRPVPVPFLHHGPVSAPRGGGHWVLLVGLDATHATFHDPYGELDNVNGGYTRRGPFGKNIRYSLKNWLPRWQAGGEAWLLDVYDPAPKAPESSQNAPAAVYVGTWASVEAVASQKGSRWPQVVAAQWALESGYGKHLSGKNNFFGIKGQPGTEKPTTEFLNGKWVTITDTFRDYPTPEACIDDLIRLWYKDFRSFKGVNRAQTWTECCHLLRSEGYATDPDYPTKLIKLIREHSQ
jgi:hypothetical protein